MSSSAERNGAREQCLLRLTRAPVRWEPFPHFYVRDVFPAWFYGQLRNNLPADSAYGKEMYPRRRVIDVVTELHTPFWESVAAWMGHASFIDAIFQRFLDVRNERYGENITVGVGYNLRLVRDEPGYELFPHTDEASKLASVLFYLPADDGMKSFGTTIFKHEDPEFTHGGGDWLPPEGFRPVWTAPFLPNSCFVFARTDRSFHGVMANDCGRERDALLLNIYARPC